MRKDDLYIFWDKLTDEMRQGLNLADLKLNRAEAKALENAPDELLELINDEFGKTTFDDHPYNFRNALVLKAVAYMLVNSDKIKEIINLSYDNAGEITGG